MSIEKDIDFQFKLVLDKIKTDYLLTPKGKPIEYKIEERDNLLSETQRKIIHKLQNLGVIKIQEEKYDPRTSKVLTVVIEIAKELEKIKPVIFILEIVQPAFNDIWSEYDNKCRNYVEKENSIFPNLPHNNNWQNITIGFFNGEEVFVSVMKEQKQADYKLMGFENKKNGKPNRQWELFRLLSEKGGRLSWDNNFNLSLKEINNIAKQKQELSKTLKKCFGINEDPFRSYKKEKAYEIKLTLIPEKKT